MNFKNIGNLIVLGFLTLAFASCEKLPLQDRFKFDPEIPEVTPFKDITALQFLELNPKNEFTFMLKAIQITEMEAEFSIDTKDRTYLILKDTAFVDGYPSGNGVNQYRGIFTELGIDSNDLKNLNTVNIDAPKRERLKTLLRYHIIGDKYIDQFSSMLPIRQQDYIFQSLVPGDEGRLSIRRTEFYGFNFNRANEIPIGTGATVGSGTNVARATGRKTTSRVQHNYVFSNGIGHLLSNYIRYKPF